MKVEKLQWAVRVFAFEALSYFGDFLFETSLSRLGLVDVPVGHSDGYSARYMLLSWLNLVLMIVSLVDARLAHLSA